MKKLKTVLQWKHNTAEQVWLEFEKKKMIYVCKK